MMSYFMRLHFVLHCDTVIFLLFDLTCTLQVAAITPSTGVSEKGSNILSDRRMKSGFCRYLANMRGDIEKKKKIHIQQNQSIN